MEVVMASVAGALTALVCTRSPKILRAVAPFVSDVRNKASCLLRSGKTSKKTRQNSGKSMGGKGVAGKRPVSTKKTTKPRAVKSPSGSASSRTEEEQQRDDVVTTEGDDSSEDEDNEESGTKKSQKAQEFKKVLFPMYMLPKEGEGDSKPVTGPGETRIVVELQGRQVIPLHINDWKVDGVVWNRYKTGNRESWVWFMEVPPAETLKSAKKDQKLLHINVYDLAKAAENKTSKGLTVSKDMVEIILMNTKEIISRAGDLNNFPDSVMAAGGPKLRGKDYDYGAK